MVLNLELRRITYQQEREREREREEVHVADVKTWLAKSMLKNWQRQAKLMLKNWQGQVKYVLKNWQGNNIRIRKQ